MNYIELINRFWKCNEEHPIGTSGAALYFYLLKINNSLGWKDTFKHSDLNLSINLGLSVNTIRNTKNKLMQLGLIWYESPKNASRGLNGITKFSLTLSKFDSVPCSDADSVPCSVPSSVPCSDTDSITKLKETKLNNVLLEKEPKGKLKFSPPSLLEIQNEISEKNLLTVNPELFFNFYESKNWMVGKNKMQNWKKAIAGWESRNKEKSNQNLQNGKQFTAPPTKTAYKFDAARIIETNSR